MTDLAGELTDADMLAMWANAPINPQPLVESDPPDEALAELESRITSMAARLAAQTREWLALVAEFNRRKGWVQWGMRSMAHWLSWSCSVGPGVAREYVRVATALTELPLVDEAFAQGQLSYSKVRAVTRVADQVDQTTLLEQAKVHSAAQLEKVIRGYRKAQRPDRPVEQRRKARWFYDEDGMLVLSARLTADEGALLVAALEQARGTGLGKDDPLPGDADALVALAQTAQAAGAVDSSGDDRHLVVVHADADVLIGADQSPDQSPDAICRIEHGPGLTADAARRLACDAALIAWVSSAVSPGKNLRLGRKTRKIPPALRRALRLRDGGCRFPGCPRMRFLDAHHVIHWADGGPTDLENLILLCGRHHRSMHEEGFTLVQDGPQRWSVRRPDGTTIPAAPPLPLTPPPDVPAETEYDPDALRPDQHGEPFSLRDSVDVFCRNPRP